MSRYIDLIKRAQQGECILIDGATGTEVDRRGVPQLDNAWNGGGALSHPKIVKQIHKDYIDSGAEIIISNTFATTKHALRDANQEHNFEVLNRRGVELAIQAREELSNNSILVAGGISYWTWTGNKPSLEELRLSVSEQAQIMRDAGANLIMLEMMIDIEQMITTIEAAKTSGLPVWVGLTCEPNKSNEMGLRDGDRLETDNLSSSSEGLLPVQVQYEIPPATRTLLLSSSALASTASSTPRLFKASKLCSWLASLRACLVVAKVLLMIISAPDSI